MLESGRKRAKEYYHKNRERMRQQAIERYYRIKNGEPKRKGGRPKKNIDPICQCQTCGREFITRLTYFKNGGGKYCSTDCYKESQRSSINSNFFSTSNAEMAYVLGIFMSDGYLTKRTSGNLSLCLKVNDKDLLETIKSLMGFDGSIHRAGITQAGNESYKIEISDPQIISDVQRWGIVERKTLISKFPTELPKEYWNDFIRGLFDGDGCIHLSKDKRRKSSYLKQCCFLGTKDILDPIPEHLGLENKIVSYKKIFKLVYYKRADLEKIFKAFYYSDTVPCLARKRIKFTDALSAGIGEPIETKPFIRNGKLVDGFKRKRCFHPKKKQEEVVIP